MRLFQVEKATRRREAIATDLSLESHTLGETKAVTLRKISSDNDGVSGCVLKVTGFMRYN
jgi:hypothetical protein